MSAESLRAAARPATSHASLRLIGLALFVASCTPADSWIIVRKDGSRIACGGPFLVFNGAYTCPDENGDPQIFPLEKVDAAKTDAANSGEVAAGPNGAPVGVERPTGFGTASGDRLITFHEPYATPSGASWSAFGVRPAEERFFVHVPESYTGRERFGLIVYTGTEEQTGLPAGWSAVLDEKKLLFVAAQGSGDSRHIFRRLGLALLGTLEMKKLYYIDPARIYAAGFSGGARVANELAFYDAPLITGAILNSGAEFYERVPQARAPSTVDTEGKPHGHGMVKLPPGRMAVVRRRTRFAMITGSRDFRRGNILDIYHGGYLAHGFHARLFDVEGMGHETCGAATLAQAIDFLER